MQRRMVKIIKDAYPAGTRLRLIHMDDPMPVADGVCGTVTAVDGNGRIGVLWDTGRSLFLIPESDRFEKI